MSPEEFIRQIAQEVSAKVSSAPPKVYEVNRSTPTGPVKQGISLPQAIVELSDNMRLANELKQRELQQREQAINVTVALIGELERNRQVGQKMLRKSRRRKDDEDDDEDEE